MAPDRRDTGEITVTFLSSPIVGGLLYKLRDQGMKNNRGSVVDSANILAIIDIF